METCSRSHTSIQSCVSLSNPSSGDFFSLSSAPLLLGDESVVSPVVVVAGGDVATLVAVATAASTTTVAAESFVLGEAVSVGSSDVAGSTTPAVGELLVVVAASAVAGMVEDGVGEDGVGEVFSDRFALYIFQLNT